MTTSVSVFLISRNNSEYVLDAIYSVINQTFKNWEFWILENSDDAKTREIVRNAVTMARDPRLIYHEIDLDYARYNAESVIKNQYYPQANGEFILYLPDEDILRSGCLKICVDYMARHPERDACYFSAEFYSADTTALWIGDYKADTVHDDEEEQIATIDGGQVFHRKSCLDKLEELFPETRSAFIHADEIFISRLIGAGYPLYPIPVILARRRYTEISSWMTAKTAEVAFARKRTAEVISAKIKADQGAGNGTSGGFD